VPDVSVTPHPERAPSARPTVTPEAVRDALRRGEELAFLDVSPEGVFPGGHPLFSASLPLGRLELDALDAIPRRSVPIVVHDHGDGAAATAVERLIDLGYTDVRSLEGGLDAWVESGGELFRDENVPSKAFGELVDETKHTPAISADELVALLDAHADVVVLDSRTFDEYQSMSIPTGVSVPGAELVYRVGALAPRAETLVVVNCAGRTRSIIGAQSLVDAAIPNRVVALRDGAIGWQLAGHTLDHGRTEQAPPVDDATRVQASVRARRVADRAGVRRVTFTELEALIAADRTVYRFDVRTSEEYDAGHLPGFRHAPGGQLVQATDSYAPVQGARIVLFDDDGARANMTGAWLAQMGHEVHVLDDVAPDATHERGPWQPTVPAAPPVAHRSVDDLARALEADAAVVLDLASSPTYLAGHIPGAAFVLRADLGRVVDEVVSGGTARQVVLTSDDGVAAAFAALDVSAADIGDGALAVTVLEGGTQAWATHGHDVATGPEDLRSPERDVNHRDYFRTDGSDFMQSYLDWEHGLVAQLERDGTNRFRLIDTAPEHEKETIDGR
jgi:rhodanese-related sulfurtransferase